MSGSESGKSPEQPLGFTVGEGNSDAAAQGVHAIPSPAGTASLAPPGSSTPLTAEEMNAVLSEQPTGAAPSPDEIEDRRDAQNSAQNVLPREKFENGLKQVCNRLLTTRACRLPFSVNSTRCCPLNLQKTTPHTPLYYSNFHPSQPTTSVTRKRKRSTANTFFTVVHTRADNLTFGVLARCQCTM